MFRKLTASHGNYLYNVITQESRCRELRTTRLYFQQIVQETNKAKTSKFRITECGLSTDGWYRKVSNIRSASVGNKIVDHSDVFGASPVGAAPTTSSFST